MKKLIRWLKSLFKRNKMARKVNLKQLYNNGDLIPSLYVGSEDVTSDGLEVLFDGDESTFKLVVNQVAGPTEQLRLSFSSVIQCNKIRLKIVTKFTDVYNIYLNGDLSKIVAGVSGISSPSTTQTNNFDLNVSGLSQIDIALSNSYSNLDHEIYEIQLFILEEADPYEFNDSVLTTKAWNSSRYDGRQLQGTVINEFRTGDSTYGKTPVLQNYTRNIYIGNDIIGMYEEGDPDDPTLLQFPRYAYAQTNYYITVNEDDTITYNILEEKNNNNNAKNGFYRAFYKDFPLGSNCKIIINDQSVKNKLKNSYPIYFNGGQLQRVLTIQSGLNGGGSGDYTQLTALTASSNGFYILDPTPDNLAYGSAYLYGAGSTIDSAVSFHSSSLHNEDIYTDWFTGSLANNLILGGGITIDALDFNEYNNFINNFLNYKNNSNYKGDKRLYITMASKHSLLDLSSGSQSQPIYTYEPGGYQTASFGIRERSLADLSTVEIVNHRMENYISTIWQSELQFSINNNLHQNYNTRINISNSYIGSGSMPPNFTSGSFIFSKLEDKNPSLLLPLNKTKELPVDIGTKNFVIVPENLHPYVKDNLTYFLTRAGIDVGGNTSPLIELNESRRNLK